MIEVKGLSVGYDVDAPALWDLEFSLPCGQLIGLFGPNGAGKSTFVKVAAGLIKPIHGGICVDGKPIEAYRKKIGYVPQRSEVDWSFPATALDVVLMGCYGRIGRWRLPGRKEKAEALSCLERVGMLDYKERAIDHLSGGQKQRVFIARALMQQADIYFMDEPFAGIDIPSEQVIIDILVQLKVEGKTIIIVHHDLKGGAELFDWIVLLNMRLIAAGPRDDVLTPELIEKAFGRSEILFQQATKLANERASGAL